MAFVASPPHFAATPPTKSARCALQMSSSKGFAPPPKKPPRTPSASETRRKAASDRYDQMAASGMPEYTIWMRLKEPPAPPSDDEAEQQEQMPWLPVGCLAVPRSNQVSKALFESEEDLMQGAIRLYPNLQNQPRENIEFGYQLREFDDEEIRIAERDDVRGVQGFLRKWFGAWQNPLNSAS